MGGGSFVRCRCGWVKLLALLSLVPLALRAGSLLARVPPPPSRPASAFIAGAVSVVSASAHSEVGQRRRRTKEGTAALAAGLSTRFRHGGAQAGFGDDKRMAPSGSNPLHNLRRRR
ncbi:uncharacterized protein LOC104582500 [Brachypodium distachyon]|uniref:Uncharacterized protein n=1 Tax=Brachypodium distachyon TaxID=15368 RepID=I1HCF4_BRADI|nr:uncharacterized protein LOC104582500 [Brachypodium distachyon]KQK02912.1 hypothetical protein BRADI_2g04410v3 [Brachypodium distachyon]|eukprot:XP_010230513.1 uncharacterized protein LOC104582500 [Brachypodium distachyon]